MNQTDMLSMATELAEVKSRQDILAAVAIYHPQAEMIAPSFDSIATGSAEIEQHLRIFFGLFPDYCAKLEQHAFNQNVMLATAQVSATLNIPGKNCHRIELPVFIEFQFHENRISKEVISLDFGMVCRLSGVRPDELIGALSAHQQSQ